MLWDSLLFKGFFLAMLMVVQVISGDVIADQASSPVVTAQSSHYVVNLVQKNIPQSQEPGVLHYDFDGDGIPDVVSPYSFYFYGLNITLSSTGKTISISSGNKGFNGVSAISFNPDGSYPSLVFATYSNSASQPTGFDYAKQVIAFNDHGTFTIKKLPLSVIGRDVSCTNHFPGRKDPVCFFDSYFDYNGHMGPSKLVVIHPDGTVADITGTAGLPFPVAPYGNGSWMIGSGMMDFSGDGLVDLIGVGRHRQILTAFSTPTGKMNYQWVGTGTPGYMRVFVPQAVDMPESSMPPCAYVGTSAGEGIDYLTCYDRSTHQWYTLNLPITSASYTHVVHFWVQDGTVVFGALNLAGKINLFSLTKPGGMAPATTGSDSQFVPTSSSDSGIDSTVNSEASPVPAELPPADLPLTTAEPQI